MVQVASNSLWKQLGLAENQAIFRSEINGDIKEKQMLNEGHFISHDHINNTLLHKFVSLWNIHFCIHFSHVHVFL